MYAGFGGGFIYVEAFSFFLKGKIDASGGSPHKNFNFLGSGIFLLLFFFS
jgi:hypothetical protein